MLSKFVVTTLISGLSSLLILFPAGAQNNGSRGDDVLLEMNKAFKRGDKNKLAQLLPQARGHALEPWATYWELKARLDDASAQEVQTVMARYAGTYQEDRLRNDWLLLLGQRRDWAGFAAEYPNYRMGDDKDVRCYALLVEHLKNPGADARLAEEVRSNWYAQRDASDGCTSAAARLVGSKNLTPQDVWVKARLATEANRPRAARDAVEIIAPEALNLVTELNNSPLKFLASKMVAVTKTRKEIIVLALVKLATSDADGAARMLDHKWDFQLTAEERNWVWGAIGKQAATRLNGDAALGYFAKVSKDSDLSDDMLGWKVRAALRAGREPRWPLVLSGINAMSDSARQDPTWVYWKARALLSNAPATAPGASIAPQRAEALALLQSIASVRGFYEQLALEELGQKISTPSRPAPLTAEEKATALQHPGLSRAIYAIGMGLRPEGVREWNYSVNLHERGGMSERQLLATAQLACDRAIWDRCINTSERTRTEMDFDQRFPTPFREAVLQRSQGIGLDPAYVYGLIRQESRFIMDARSGVGASGLMQVMPATARETARYIGLTGFTADQINDRDTNIVIGTAYLKRALDDFGGSMPLAAAAYNAGPGRPRVWRNGPVLEAAIWAENVPFAETRDYVKKVLSNTTNYAALLSGQPQSLKARLGTVGPREASAPPPDEKMP
ncbi:lytic transglycosylase domain-containing protein [Polaromonas sp. SM01]|uniref:lytic transglycosylase domain-containing protein n=1 Tax=Polaromonas sp. SM01 TaxID=3085630 RepID=UPI002981C6FE|nr:transglycosylase SLT domain-containing protein [Polaromonas sp. SM01]MDW5444222.1 transglycosylase SLT domain-containing protein [Polaromonas sp. SM01]